MSAIYKELFSDAETRFPKMPLQKICSKIGSGATPKGGKTAYISEGISLIRSTNVFDFNFEYGDLAHINQSQADALANVIVEPNDVLFNITGVSVARCCMVPADVLPARVNQHVMIVRPIMGETMSYYIMFTLCAADNKAKLLGISLLVELSEFYQVSIPEIINGERKSEKMNQETKDTAIKMAEYSKNELNTEKRKIISALLMIFGVFIIISAFAIFPNESSWGSIYSIIGGAILTIGIYFRMKSVLVKKVSRILSVVGCVIVLFGIFTVSDYIAVSQFQQVPRFSYEKSYGEDIVEHKTLLYTVIQKNSGTANESIEIKK